MQSGNFTIKQIFESYNYIGQKLTGEHFDKLPPTLIHLGYSPNNSLTNQARTLAIAINNRRDAL